MPIHGLIAVIRRQDDAWISWCPEIDIASQGDTIEQAKANLKEVVELYVETAKESEIKELLGVEMYVSSFEVNVG